MSDLKLNLIMSAREKITGPLAAVLKGSKKVGAQLGAQRKALQLLQKSQSDVQSFEKMASANSELANEFNKAQAKVDRYRRAVDRSDGTNKKFNKGLAKAERELTRVQKKYGTSTNKLNAFKNKLHDTGINTRDLTAEQQRLSRAIESQSRHVDKLRGRYRFLMQAQARVNTVSEAGGKVMHTAGRTAAVGIAAAGASGYFFKTQFLDSAAEFEKFEAILKTVEGSSSKARSSMKWVSDFAAKTPYELAQVTEAFVKLRAYGMDPKNGLLNTLGDTSAAMGKDVMDAVEAIADAITGENERLKEFGIRASKSGGEITYEYTNKAGKQKTAVVDGSDRAAIEATLKTIWNEKFAGAMRERSKTWQGMMSNMSDQWTRFTNMVMSQGLFDWMKGKLGGLLAKIDQMAADGTLEKVAKDWGTKLMGFATGLWSAGEGVANLVSGFSDLAGGADNAIYILAGLSLAPLISSVIALGVALGPIGWTLAGISALVTGITYAFKNWDKISEYLREKFGPSDSFTSAGATRTANRRNIATNKPAIAASNKMGDAVATLVDKINIYAAPGMDEKAVAMEVTKQIDAHNQSARRRQRSRMSNED
ncbi:tape measure protein [Thalassolituus oleivorans]|uniref:tape measure protein n=1 Tax=Thalassolituus oleivorans TaxID=187493 RepID=UPI0023F09F62|nr:tape measure protein [Thalassolituus oleivorans]